jgi:hypothetical protein
MSLKAINVDEQGIVFGARMLIHSFDGKIIGRFGWARAAGGFDDPLALEFAVAPASCEFEFGCGAPTRSEQFGSGMAGNVDGNGRRSKKLGGIPDAFCPEDICEGLLFPERWGMALVVDVRLIFFNSLLSLILCLLDSNFGDRIPRL